MTDTDFDLASVDARDEATLDIKHPATGLPTGWRWTFYGPGHPETVKIAEQFSRELLREQRDHRQAQLNGKKVKLEQRSTDEVRTKNVDSIVGRTKSFTPIKLNDRTIEFSAASARELLLDPRKGWLFGQISEFLTEESSFIQPSATS